MNDEDLHHFSKYIVPIYLREDGKLLHEGTGFLVNSGENHYLVSAAHVFRQCAEKELLFITGNGKGCLIQFNAMMYNKAVEDDSYDIGVMAILEHKPPYFSINKDSINIKMLLPNLSFKLTKDYGIIGFPASKSYSDNLKKKVSVKLYGYAARSCEETNYRRAGITSKHHIALEFDRLKCSGSEGSKKAFPKPYGMSGSPIIYFPKGTNNKVDAQSYIVGVATTYLEREKLIYGADISIAMQFMRELDEEIKAKKALNKAI